MAYATKKEVHALITEMVEDNSAALKRGEMRAPWNSSHLAGEMNRRGMAYPEGILDYIDWLRGMGAGQLCKRLARKGHWLKGHEAAAGRYHAKNQRSPFDALPEQAEASR